MIDTYRYDFGKWTVLSVLFIAGVATAIERDQSGFDPNNPPSPAAGIPLQQSAAPFPCEHMIYGISADGVRYVHEAGGGTVYAARLNQWFGFYQLNPYGYMVPVDHASLDAETAGNLRKALLQCLGPWLPSGAWFTLSAKVEQ
jgi:hypothetical protein